MKTMFAIQSFAKPVLLLSVLILTACAPSTADGLRSMAADMDAAQYAAAMQATQAQAAIIAERTAVAQATSYAIEADRQRLAVTQTAQEMRATDYAATATAWIGTVDANAYMANLEANHKAALQEIDRAQRDAEVDMMLVNATWILIILMGYATATLAALLAFSLILARYRRAKWRYSGVPLASLPVGDVVDVPSTPNQDVMDMLERAIAVNSPGSNLIPRHDKMGMSGAKRTALVSKLRVYGCVTTTPGDSTLLTHGYTLETLLEEFRAGRMGVR